MSARQRLAAWLWAGGPADQAQRRQVAADAHIARLLERLAEATELARTAVAGRAAARVQTAAAQHAADQLGAELRDRDERIRRALLLLDETHPARPILAAAVEPEPEVNRGA